jgi:hypothetical protein
MSLAGRGIRLMASGDRVELVTAPEAGPARRPLRRRRRNPPLAGVARDAGDRGLPPAPDQVGDRADPGRGFGVQPAHAPAPPPRRRARPGRCPGPAVPVRDRLRLPRALRADQPRRAAAARLGGRRPADDRRRRGNSGAAAGRLPAGRTTDGHRTPPEGAGRGRCRLAPGGRADDRRRAGHRRRQGGHAGPARRPRRLGDPRRRPGDRRGGQRRPPRDPQADRGRVDRRATGTPSGRSSTSSRPLSPRGPGSTRSAGSTRIPRA